MPARSTPRSPRSTASSFPHQPVQPAPVSVARMQAIDRTAIETIGIPRLLLMEHAGLAIARCARQLLPEPTQSIVVCCGSGFNGGDGLAAARHLHEWGYQLRLTVTGRLDRLREEPAIYARILRHLGLSIQEISTAEEVRRIDPWIAECGLIIDALLGIGVQGTVREPHTSLINAMNQARKPILAVDIPSGLDGDTGHPQEVAVKATVTVTFGLPKQGCVIGEGPTHTGSLIVESITIPHTLFTGTS